MKLFLITFVLAVGLGACFTRRAIAASQPQSLGLVTMSTSTVTGGLGLWTRTASQITTLTPSTTGQVIYCTDCASNGGAGTICISTGSTAAFQWVLSTGTQCK